MPTVRLAAALVLSPLLAVAAGLAVGRLMGVHPTLGAGLCLGALGLALTAFQLANARPRHRLGSVPPPRPSGG